MAWISTSWDGPPAPPVPVLPASVEAAALPPAGRDGAQGVPIGLEELGLDPVYLDLCAGDPHFLVLGDGGSGKSNLLRLFAQGLTARHDPGRARLVIVDYRRALIDLSGGPDVHAYAANAPMVTEVVAALCAELEARQPGSDVSHEELRGPTWSGPRYYVLVDDYDLVPGATSNPLTPLLDLLAHGREVGLHLVARPPRRRHVHLGLRGLPAAPARAARAGPADERQHDRGHPADRPSRPPAPPPPPGRGLLVDRNSEPRLIQTAVAPQVQPGSETDRGEGRAAS